MTILFGGSAAPAVQSQVTPAASGIRFQSSCYGRVISICWGTDRLAANMIGYGNFRSQSHTVEQAQPSSGKGGGIYGDQAQVSSTTYYTYTVGLMLGICEGPIQSFGQLWNSKSKKSSATTAGWTVFHGGYPQTPWSSRALLNATMGSDGMGGYNGLSYLAASAYALGQSPNLPNVTVEVNGILTSTYGQDIPPGAIINDLITNQKYGLGLSVSFVGPVSNYIAYTASGVANLLMSLTLSDQRSAADIINELLIMSNTDATFSEGRLIFIPRGDVSSGNYVAPSSIFSFGDDDLLPLDSGDTVEIDRKDPADLVTTVALECIDRTKDYNPAVVRATDAALLAILGPRPDQVRQAKMFKTLARATNAAQLLVQRQGIMNTFRFRLPAGWFILDPGDIVSLTNDRLGLDEQPVKIIEMECDSDGNWNFLAEAYGVGTGTANSGGTEGGSGGLPNYDVSAGDIDSFAIFEMPAAFTNGLLQVSVAAACLDSNYGGCEIWVSNDDLSYSYAGRIAGSCRIGVIGGSGLPPVEPSTTPPTSDLVNPLFVDLTESGGTLASVSNEDQVALNSACYVGATASGGVGEIVAYQDALLTAANQYTLTDLLRGCYGSQVANHSSGAKFVRMDSSIVQVPYSSDRIGQTIYVKFLTFNQYGSGLQQIGDVSAHQYVIAGTAYVAPTENPPLVQASDIQNIYAMLGVMQIAISKQQNKAFMIDANGNYLSDSFATSSYIDTTYSVNMTLNRTQGFISPSVAAAGLVSRTAGTIIGNMDDMSRAFDNVGSKPYNLCSSRSGLNAASGEASFIGKDFGVSPIAISSVIVKGSNDRGFGPVLGPTQATIAQRIWASNVLPTSPTGPGNPISQFLITKTRIVAAPANYSEAAGRTLISQDKTTTYRYIWHTGTLSGGSPSQLSRYNVAQMAIYQAATPNNMKAVSQIQTAAQTVTYVSFLTILEEIDAITLGTDLFVDIATNAAAMTITAASKANPCVITCTAGQIATAGLQNGENVFISGVKGMTELNGGDYTVQNVNTGANTFELAGVNSTGYGTFTGTARALRATWTAIAIADAPGPSGGVIRTIQSAFQAIVSGGTKLVYRVRSLNSKRFNLRGVQMIWK